MIPAEIRADPEKITAALTGMAFTNVMGAKEKFDDHNQAGKVVLIEKVMNRQVTVAKLVALGH